MDLYAHSVLDPITHIAFYAYSTLTLSRIPMPIYEIYTTEATTSQPGKHVLVISNQPSSNPEIDGFDGFYHGWVVCPRSFELSDI